MQPSNEIHIPSIIVDVKNMGFDLKGKMIFAYDFKQELYVYCGTDPNIYDSLIRADEKKVFSQLNPDYDKIP